MPKEGNDLALAENVQERSSPVRNEAAGKMRERKYKETILDFTVLQNLAYKDNPNSLEIISPDYAREQEMARTHHGTYTTYEDYHLTKILEKNCNMTWAEISQELASITGMDPHDPRELAEHCRRTLNYNHEPFTEQEDALLLDLKGRYGNNIHKIALCVADRSDEEVRYRLRRLERGVTYDDPCICNWKRKYNSDGYLKRPIVGTHTHAMQKLSVRGRGETLKEADRGAESGEFD